MTTTTTTVTQRNQSRTEDGWEFPRHHLNVINILGEGCFGQVWKCEALNIAGWLLFNFIFHFNMKSIELIFTFNCLLNQLCFNQIYLNYIYNRFDEHSILKETINLIINHNVD